MNVEWAVVSVFLQQGCTARLSFRSLWHAYESIIFIIGPSLHVRKMREQN